MKKYLLIILLITFSLTYLIWGKFLPSFKSQKTQQKFVNFPSVTVDKVNVYKERRELEILQNGKVIKTYKMRLGFEPEGHKTMQGDGRTPEGKYTLDWRNPNSQYYRSIHIDYPNSKDRAYAKQKGISPGGDIMIHGSVKKELGSPHQEWYDYLPQSDWTLGCIAVSNQDMDELWANIKDGTTIEIYP